jgi:hypothetical protein
MPRSLLSPADAAEIKRRLWSGETCDAVASRYPDITVSAIRSILSGNRWSTIPWPEKDKRGRTQTGAMPKTRAGEIHRARREAHRDALAQAVKKLNKKENAAS